MCDIPRDQVTGLLNALDGVLDKIQVLSELAELIEAHPDGVERGRLALVVLHIIHDYATQLIAVSETFAQSMPRCAGGRACP